MPLPGDDDCAIATTETAEARARDRKNCINPLQLKLTNRFASGFEEFAMQRPGNYKDDNCKHYGDEGVAMHGRNGGSQFSPTNNRE